MLHLKHYPAFKGGEEDEDVSKKATPVLLIHGLSANHRVFDLRREKSLAWALCEKGYDVWLLDLRGTVTASTSNTRSSA